MTHKEYNGWYNYETWVTALWLDNEEGVQAERMERVQAIVDTEPVGRWRREVAQAIEAWVTEDMIPDLGASLAADLMGAALSEVNWEEIADHYIEDADKPEPDEDEESETEDATA